MLALVCWQMGASASALEVVLPQPRRQAREVARSGLRALGVAAREVLVEVLPVITLSRPSVPARTPSAHLMHLDGEVTQWVVERPEEVGRRIVTL